MTSSRELIELLKEAVALEAAGAEWTQKHAAAVTGYAVSTLRLLGCPKHHKPGSGPKGRPTVVYLPAEVRAWNAARRRQAVA